MFNMIGCGTTRDVYAINDDIVVKIAQNLDLPESWGVGQCKNELKTFLKYGDALPLCKIFVDMSSESRIVMERITPIDQCPNRRFGNIDQLMYRLRMQTEMKDPDYIKSFPKVVQEFVENILKSGLTRDEISNIIYDVETSNIGIKNNKLLILDYGLQED